MSIGNEREQACTVGHHLCQVKQVVARDEEADKDLCYYIQSWRSTQGQNDWSISSSESKSLLLVERYEE